MRAIAWIGMLAALGLAQTWAARPLVVTSCLPLYCWTMHVAGNAARVQNLLPPRAEPHDYAFTPGDARRLNDANLIIVNGLGLEPWLLKWLRGSGPGAELKIVNVSEALRGSIVSGFTGERNPHLWLDPRLACTAVSNIAAALQRVDPEHAVLYASNAVAYAADLRQLDAEIEAGLAGMTNRAIVTYHDAFPYFAARYHLQVAGVVEKVPEVNPTPKYLAWLSREVRARHLRAIFIGRNSSSRLARQIAHDLGVQLVELDTLETGDASADTYERALRGNLAVLRRTLH